MAFKKRVEDRSICDDLNLLGNVWQGNIKYVRALERARLYTRQGFDRCERPYIAISGGKDSVAMLAIVSEVWRNEYPTKDFTAWIHVSDASFPGTIETARDACEKCEVPLIVDESPVSAFSVMDEGSRARFGKKGFLFSAIENLIRSGRDAAFVGVRGPESHRRMKAVLAKGAIFETTVPAPHLKIQPISFFSVEDVAATLVRYEMPIHPIYSKIPVNGRPIRLGYVTQKDLREEGVSLFIQRNYPEIWNRLEQIRPDSASEIR